jgi:hypothetical protein
VPKASIRQARRLGKRSAGARRQTMQLVLDTSRNDGKGNITWQRDL